ncbi:hypothetical protein Ddye_012518 [Dipteronia dyeriana]|uniref:Zinc finger PMZ-type domain-containing protein n=1 Tax=Dipteronia dyeriana TaxID=168575 RepID=A0AAE0CIQ8_9ROSI|nr:hypothetical protein Ddye_012518 [Dipteronia dyeriana]
MRQNFGWKVKRSNKTTLHLVCLMGNCTSKLRAVRRDEETCFQVRSFVNEHTGPLEEIHRRHRQANAVIIGEVIAPRIQQQDGRLMHLKDIIVDMKSIKAQSTLDYALSLTYGTHEKTFQLLTSFGYVLERKNPDTFTDLQCNEDGKFLYFFMSIGASLRGIRTFMHPDVAVIINKAAHAYNEFEYNQHMEELRNLHKNAYDYVIDASPHKWSCVHCPERRNMLQRWLHDRYRAAQFIRQQLNDATHLVILKRVEKCGFMTVNLVDWNVFSVKRSEKQWTVDLAHKTCTCNKFQMDHFPYSHALEAVRERNLDLTSLCLDYYKRQTLIDTYSVPIIPVGHPST